LFDKVTNQKAIGEASVYSLYLPNAPLQIKKYVPQAKMFAILRNPADRAYSSYLHVVRQARERLPFARALQEEPERIRRRWNAVWYFKTLGFYYEQVKRYFDTFGRNQIHVYLYEDFQREPVPLMKRVFEILGVDSSFVPDMSKRAKASYVPKNPAWEKFLHKTKVRVQFSEQHFPKRIRWRVHKVGELIDRVARSNRMSAPPPMPEDVRTSLLADYREDILKLQDLLNRDLSRWLAPTTEPVGARA
jgi:Sulfotransferase domain